MNPLDFEKIVIEAGQKNSTGINSIDSIVNAILAKLKMGQYITDDAIVASVQVLYTRQILNKSDLKIVAKYVDDIIYSLYKRELLEAKLLSSKISFLSIPESYGNEEYNKIKEAAIKRIVEITSDNISTSANLKYYYLLELGHLFEMIGDKKSAEEKYIEIQSFPFWTILDAKLLPKMRGYYIDACRSRIEINRGNIKGLGAISYPPSVAEDIEPILKLYVEELGVSWKKFNGDDN